MFVLTAFVYPAVLALLCVGAGLLVDRCSGGALHAALLVPVGAAALIAVSQLTTYFAALAPATPVVMAVVAAAGLALAWRKGSRRSGQGGVAAGTAAGGALRKADGPAACRCSCTRSRSRRCCCPGARRSPRSWRCLTPRCTCSAPTTCCATGRATRTWICANSSGQFVKDYYGSGYPSGADTLFGGSAFAARAAADLGLSAIHGVHARRSRPGRRGCSCAAWPGAGRGLRWRRSACARPRSCTHMS